MLAKKTKTRKRTMFGLNPNELPFSETEVTLEDIWKKLEYIEKMVENVYKTVNVIHMDQ